MSARTDRLAGVIGRRVVPLLPAPLAIIATALAAAPWLRSFPASTIAVPIFGAAALSVLVPVVVTRLATRRLLVGAVIDVIAFVVYTLLAVLRDPTGWHQLTEGFWRGPAQLLTFALPLVDPLSLMVVPVALCWLAGAAAGESMSRSGSTLIPYVGWLLCCGAAYAATARGAIFTTHARVRESIVAAALLLCMALFRMCQNWLLEDGGSSATQPGSALPIKGLAIGAVTAAIVVTVAAVVVQSSAFGGHPAAPERVAAINQSAPVTPLEFVSALRATTGAAASTPILDVSLDRTAPAFITIATVDYYDGDSWSFTRTFRPSGGVVPADLDPTLNPNTPLITQRYRLVGRTLTADPWMPYLDRPTKIDGVSVSIDQGSGMVIPTDPLQTGAAYTVRSDAGTDNLLDIPTGSLPATSEPPIDTQIPASLRGTLDKVVASLSAETGQSSSSPVAYLQALAHDFEQNYGLSGTAPSGASTIPSATPSSSTPSSSTPSSTGTATASSAPTPVATGTAAADEHIGATTFSDVLNSVLGPLRSATPEQYATLYALVARELGVPARVVTGFQIRSDRSGTTVPAGRYALTPADAYTWVEIPIQGQGWVVVDPAPTKYSNQRSQQSVGAAPSNSASASPSQNALVTQANGGHAVAPKSAVPHQRATHHPIRQIALIAAAVLLVIVILLLIAPKFVRRRRRRRRRLDPRARVIGAWQESLDVLAECGLRDLSSMTKTEIANDTRARFGVVPATHTLAIGQAADLAIFAPARVVTVEAADAAWNTQADLRRALRRELPVRSRVMSAVRYHRSRRPEPGPAPASWADRPQPSKRRRFRRRRGRHAR